MKSSVRTTGYIKVLLIFPFILGNLLQSQTTGVLVDSRDGKSYKTVKIGNQWWMAENLAFVGNSTRSEIDLVTAPEKWVSLNGPGYCWYDNDPSTYEDYGVLYNWYAANTESICPQGWRVPTDADWMELERFLGMDPQEVEAEGIRGEVIGGKMKACGTEYWNPPNDNANNMSGFTALPEGHRNGGSGQFVDMRSFGTWWTQSAKDEAYAWRRTLHCNDSKIRRFASHKRDGFSIRCIKEE